MRPDTARIDELEPDPENLREHPERNMEALRNSLRKFGQQRPIVVRESDGVVIAGNGLLQAARDLGWEEVEVVWTDLEGEDATAFAIADNRTAELSRWNLEKLSKTLQDMEDAEGLGWAPWDLDALLGADWRPPGSDGDGDEEDSEGRATGGRPILIVVPPENREEFESIQREMSEIEDRDVQRLEVLLELCRSWREANP